MKDELLSILSAYDVTDVRIDRNVMYKGQAATGVEVDFTDVDGNDKVGEFTFIKGNHITTQHMANIIISVITKRKYL